LRAGAIKTIRRRPGRKPGRPDAPCRDGGHPARHSLVRLTPEQRHWVIHGTPSYKEGNWNKQWYGIRRFFEYLETKSYKMHIRVLLSKYRSYTPCESCNGARLKTESLLWRIGGKEDPDAVLEPARRFMPAGVQWTRAQLEALPGLCLHDLMLMPIDRLRRFSTPRPAGCDARRALKLLLGKSGAPDTCGCRHQTHAGPPEPHLSGGEVRAST
jgi:excinuclease ABC subunit A